MGVPTTFMDVLKLIGSPIFVGIILSLLIKEWVWFAARKTGVKWLIVGGISLFLPILSRALILYLPGGVVFFLEDWWPTVAIGLGIWVTSQVWNDVFNKKIAERTTSVFLEPPK